MTEVMDMSKLIAAAKEKGLSEEEFRALLPLMIEAQDLINKDRMKKAKGGDIGQQMEMFQDGGLKDEGGTKDPVSGNDVPPGATQEEVRDDIPAQLSEGEFVFPADVVRYIGLEKLMTMRQEAKMGLKMMEKMGQMGNSEEATMPDDMPFSIIDIEIAEDDDEEEDKDKTIKANTGTYVPPAIAEPAQSFRYTPTTNRPKEEGRASFATLMGDVGGPDEYRTYTNNEGAEIQVPFKNGEVLTGFSIPIGFDPKPDEVKAEKVKTARVDTSKVDTALESSDDNNNELSDLGGARTSIGGIEYAVQYNLDGSIGLQSIDNYNKTGQVNFQKTTKDIADAIKTQTLGQLGELAYISSPKTKAALQLAQKAGITIPKVSEIDNVIKRAKVATTELNNRKNQQIFDTTEFLRPDQIIKEDDFEKKTGRKKLGRDLFTGVPDAQGRGVQRGLTPTETEMRSIQSGLQSGTGQLDTSGIDLSNIGSGVDLSGGESISTDDQQESNIGGEVGASVGEFGGIGDFKQGGLAKKKKKTKVKKKKRSGLASKK